jgi:hypothetical protein
VVNDAIGVLAAVLAVGIPLCVLLFGWRSITLLRRTLALLRRTGTAYVCVLPRGQFGPGFWILCVDHGDVALWKARRTPVKLAAFATANAIVRRTRVQVNIARLVDGVQITAADKNSLSAALYPDPGWGFTGAIRGPELDQAIATLRASLDQPKNTSASA